MILFYWQFQFCFIVSNDELLKPCLFLRIDIRSPRSVPRCFLVPNGLRGSVETNYLVRETKSNFSYHSPRSFIRSPRSVVRLDLSFPLLRRPSTVIISHFEKLACWGDAFPWIAHENRSRELFHSSRGWYVRRYLARRLIIGRDFAVTRSSPEPCWDRFAIVSEHTVELKWLILNKHNKWFHSSRVKFPLVRMSASWFLVSMYLIWIFGSRLVRSNNQSSATLWVLETCLIVGLFPFNDHLDHCFVVFKHIQQSFLMRRLDVWGNRINIIQHVGLPLRSLTLVNDNGSPQSLSSLSHVS